MDEEIRRYYDRGLEDTESLETVVRVARVVEQEPAIIGASSHFLAVARRG